MSKAVPPKNSTARYLVAKYIPNLRRMEPRNIGVVVVSPEGIAARFLGEKEESGDVDGRAVPAYVRSVSAYKQWIAHWRGIVAAGEMEDGTGEVIPFRQEAFADALLHSGKGTYCLVDGGFLLDRVGREGVFALTQQLYRELVASDEAEVRPTLESQLKIVLKQTRLDKSAHFLTDYAVPLTGGEGSAPLTFSYAFKNGSLQRLYERVSLYLPQIERNVYSAAYKFERVIGTVVDKQQTAALVYAPEKTQKGNVEEYLNELRSVTRVINLADIGDAEKEFAALPALAKH